MTSHFGVGPGERLATIVVVAAVLATSTGCSQLAQAVKNQPCDLDTRAPFHLIRVEPERHILALVWHDSSGEPFGTIEAVRASVEEKGERIVAITNAGIYEPGLVPTGLFVENGAVRQALNTTDGEGNFYLKPNGVFAITPAGPRIDDTSRFSTLADSILFATQSGPLLVNDGEIHPAFTPGSANCRVRSGVGVGDDGVVYLALSNGAVNFYDFARYFRNELGVSDALYLDGGISEMFAPGAGLHPTGTQRYAAMIVVTERAASDVR